MTELEIKCICRCRRPPLFLYFFSYGIKLKIPYFLIILVCLLFGNIIMTGELVHTASKERMATELMFHLNMHPNYQLLT